MTTTTATAKATGVEIHDGLVYLVTSDGQVLAGTDRGPRTPGNAGPFDCECGAHYTSTDDMVQHVAFYCPRLHPEA